MWLHLDELELHGGNSAPLRPGSTGVPFGSCLCIKRVLEIPESAVLRQLEAGGSGGTLVIQPASLLSTVACVTHCPGLDKHRAQVALFSVKQD